MCLEQLEMLSEKKRLRIFDGEQRTGSATEEETEGHVRISQLFTQQNNNVDSTSSLRNIAGVEESDTKMGRGEDCDALSINADTSNSDIEGSSCEEWNTDASAALPIKAAEQPDDLVMDIEKSVSEILGLAELLSEEIPPAAVNVLPEDVQPSAQQLDLLELEMRARAIKALMMAGDVKTS
ncbi:caspase activity and apoptosis inhibitor 1-like [Xenopus laevis]|nr:caspase activity and apoptosis inhibitor 1-like [Xenopus laevis]